MPASQASLKLSTWPSDRTEFYRNVSRDTISPNFIRSVKCVAKTQRIESKNSPKLPDAGRASHCILNHFLCVWWYVQYTLTYVLVGFTDHVYPFFFDNDVMKHSGCLDAVFNMLVKLVRGDNLPRLWNLLWGMCPTSLSRILLIKNSMYVLMRGGVREKELLRRLWQLK